MWGCRSTSVKLDYLFSLCVIQHFCTRVSLKVTHSKILDWWRDEASRCPLWWLTAWPRLPALYWCFNWLVRWGHQLRRALCWGHILIFYFSLCVCVCWFIGVGVLSWWKTGAVKLSMGQWYKWDPCSCEHQYTVIAFVYMSDWEKLKVKTPEAPLVHHNKNKTCWGTVFTSTDPNPKLNVNH